MAKIKLKGSSNFISAMIVLTVISIMILYGLAFNKDFAKKQNLDSIAREYIIKLETHSNLTAAEKSNFQNEVKNRIITELGSDVDSGSINVVAVTNTYGNNISLTIECKVKLDQNKFIDGFRFNTGSAVYGDYRRTIASTSTE